MAYVAKDDIIVFIENENDFIQGSSQTHELILYRDFIGTPLNLNQPTSFDVALYVGDKKVIQYSNPNIPGVSLELDIDRAIDTGKISFEISESLSSTFGDGKLFAQVSVFYGNYYPQPKSYVLPRLAIGYVIDNPNIDNSTGIGGGNSNTANNTTTNITEFTIEYTDGSNPSRSGMISMNSYDPPLVDSIILKNLDKNNIRISELENFLAKRITNEGITGNITIHDTDDTNMYAIYKIEGWERLDLNEESGDTEDVDGIKINISLETISSGPGVSKHTWSVGQVITFKLDAFSIPIESSTGILTYTDKNINPTPTSGDNAHTGILISYDPYQDSYVIIEINGLSVEVGDGTKDKDAYFSGNGGASAVHIEEIRSGDELYWNGLISGYDLEAGDEVNLIYEAKSEDLR